MNTIYTIKGILLFNEYVYMKVDFWAEGRCLT